jgi:hypothetical protein
MMHSKKGPNVPLTDSAKKRGRKAQVRVSEICHRAYDLKQILDVNRKKFDWEQLLAAKSDEELAHILRETFDRAKELLLHKPGLLLSALHDRQFPKKSRQAQEQFIVDSLAALGQVSIRRSRDIVQRERSIRKKRGTILRREFYIECSCEYEGPAYRDACPKCGAEVSYWDFIALE